MIIILCHNLCQENNQGEASSNYETFDFLKNAKFI